MSTSNLNLSLDKPKSSFVNKLIFIVLLIISFVIILRLSMSLVSWLFQTSGDPILINGTTDAKHMKIIPQNPNLKNSIPILRSTNQPDGLDFTWSVWIFLEGYSYKENEYKHIFHKGNDNMNPLGLIKPINAPGLYLTPNTNDLLVVMNTFDEITEEILVKDIPINKWVNIVVRVRNQKQLDVYINGVLTKRHILGSVVRQNYEDVYVTMNGGFDGYISSLRYFNSALDSSYIKSLVSNGPNMKMIESTDLQSKPRYLSTRWYFDNNDEVYNL